MRAEPQLGDDAPWRRRFRAPTEFPSVARANPQRGLVSSNRSGMAQLYAWDVATGNLRQLTHVPKGRPWGMLSADGRFVYYLQTELGYKNLGIADEYPTKDKLPMIPYHRESRRSSMLISEDSGVITIETPRRERSSSHPGAVDAMSAYSRVSASP